MSISYLMMGGGAEPRVMVLLSIHRGEGEQKVPFSYLANITMQVYEFQALIPNLEEFSGSYPLGAYTGGGGKKVTFCYLANITMQNV